MSSGKIIIQVEKLRKVYDSSIAVSDVTFEVYEGEIFGMVGPNGAGKTTTIECIEGLRNPDGGRVSLMNLNPAADGRRLRSRIGIQLQESALPERIKVWEAMDLFSSFYPRRSLWQSLLKQLGLEEKRNTAFAKLSGGQKQRLFIALALINDPDVIFLDELTTGLDPQARRLMWDLIKGIRKLGKTIFLTTHFMEEAERLCDRVAIINKGIIVALDTPENLIRSLGSDHRLICKIKSEIHPERLKNIPGVTKVELSGDRVIIYGKSNGFISEVIGEFTRSGVEFQDLKTEQPTLEDVFLTLTGNEMRD